MTPHKLLTTALKCFVISFIAFMCLILCNCAPSWNGVCRHNALYASAVVEGFPTYVMVGELLDGSQSHAQAFLFLCVTGSTVEVGYLEHRMKNIRIYTEREYQVFLRQIKERVMK